MNETCFSDLEYVLKRARNDSPLRCRVIDSLHREAFATSSLSIGEYSPVIALKNPLKNIPMTRQSYNRIQ